jgi:hypothetical protein
MAKADRLERMDKRRADLEIDYRAALIEALRVTAAGQWGLFGHNKDKQARTKAAPLVDGLVELAEEIDACSSIWSVSHSIRNSLPRADRSGPTQWASRSRHRPGWIG